MITKEQLNEMANKAQAEIDRAGYETAKAYCKHFVEAELIKAAQEGKHETFIRCSSAFAKFVAHYLRVESQVTVSKPKEISTRTSEMKVTW